MINFYAITGMQININVINIWFGLILISFLIISLKLEGVKVIICKNTYTKVIEILYIYDRLFSKWFYMRFFPIFLLLMLFSCNRNISPKTEMAIKESSKQNVLTNSQSSIRFLIKPKRINSDKGDLEIEARLLNLTSDTVFFLSGTCEYYIYSVEMEFTDYVLMPQVFCNSTSPIVLNIAPGGHFSFMLYLDENVERDSLKLGFDFMEVQGSTIADQFQINQIGNRSEEAKKILWSDKVKIAR